MRLTSWGGARPNRYDMDFHTEPEGKRFYVLPVDGKFYVMDSLTEGDVFSDEDELTAQCERDLRNEQCKGNE